MKITELYQEYRRTYMKNLSPNTVSGYDNNFNKHILPILGDIEPGEITCSSLDDIYETMHEKKLVNNTIRYVLRTLSSMLKFALRRGYITENIFEVYDMPKANKYQIQTLSTEQIKMLLDYLREIDDDIWLAVLFEAMLGMRRGESLGIKCTDIQPGKIHIQRSVNHCGGCTSVTTDGKTEHSNRIIYLTEEVEECIEVYSIRRPTNPSGYLSRNKYGEQLTNNVLQKHYKKALQVLNLPDVRLHDLRHSCATNLMEQGADPKIVSQILGHSDVKTTLSLYDHPSVKAQEKCLRQYHDLLNK